VKKRSVSIRGHRTSLSLEDAFWDELSAMAEARDMSVAALITEI
jgi:predicted DNA-binding ribbon-helix-helix protein